MQPQSDSVGHPHHGMLPMNEFEEAAIVLGTTLNPGGVSGGQGPSSYGPPHEHCPKHRRDGKTDEVGNNGGNNILGNKESPSNVATAGPGPHGAGGGAVPGSAGTENPGCTPGSNPTVPGGPSSTKKHDPKEIMKKRRERAICIDRVSRVIFPSTFILLNIIYWLVFSEILDAIRYSVGGGGGDDDHY